MSSRFDVGGGSESKGDNSKLPAKEDGPNGRDELLAKFAAAVIEPRWDRLAEALGTQAAVIKLAALAIAAVAVFVAITALVGLWPPGIAHGESLCEWSDLLPLATAAGGLAWVAWALMIAAAIASFQFIGSGAPGSAARRAALLALVPTMLAGISCLWPSAWMLPREIGTPRIAFPGMAAGGAVLLIYACGLRWWVRAVEPVLSDRYPEQIRAWSAAGRLLRWVPVLLLAAALWGWWLARPIVVPYSTHALMRPAMVPAAACLSAALVLTAMVLRRTSIALRVVADTLPRSASLLPDGHPPPTFRPVAYEARPADS